MEQKKERLVFATGNAHKMVEIRAILGDRYDVVSIPRTLWKTARPLRKMP